MTRTEHVLELIVKGIALDIHEDEDKPSFEELTGWDPATNLPESIVPNDSSDWLGVHREERRSG